MRGSTLASGGHGWGRASNVRRARAGSDLLGPPSGLTGLGVCSSVQGCTLGFECVFGSSRPQSYSCMPMNPWGRARGCHPLGKAAPRGLCRGRGGGQTARDAAAWIVRAIAFCPQCSLSFRPGLPGGPWPCRAPFAMPWTLIHPSVQSMRRPGVRTSRPWAGRALGPKIPGGVLPATRFD